MHDRVCRRVLVHMLLSTYQIFSRGHACLNASGKEITVPRYGTCLSTTATYQYHTVNTHLCRTLDVQNVTDISMYPIDALVDFVSSVHSKLAYPGHVRAYV